jgi:hypothetical protein
MVGLSEVLSLVHLHAKLVTFQIEFTSYLPCILCSFNLWRGTPNRVEHLFREEVIAISDSKNVQDEDEPLRGFSDS